MVIQSDDQSLHAIVTTDLGWLRERELTDLTQRLSEQTVIAPERLVITFSHTHSAGNFDLDRVNDTGGHLITPYLTSLPERLAGAIREAVAHLQPVELAYTTGRCDLACNRDYWDAETRQYVCGTNPDRRADDTVMALRITDRGGKLIATLVNYACHPTTLAWENTLISPDYIGAMREVVEQATGAPCLFLLGACGDLGPRDGFTGDTAVADRNGRQLGYAALSALESMNPPGTEMRYAGPVVSGATIGTWRHEPLSEARLKRVGRADFRRTGIDLPLLEIPAQEQLEHQLKTWQEREALARQEGRDQDAAECRAQVERARRALRRAEGVRAIGPVQYGATIWNIGEGAIVLVSGEPYNTLQRELRSRFPGAPILVGVLCNNGIGGYLLPRDDYGKGIYQESAAVLGPGCLEKAIDVIAENLKMAFAL